MRVSEDRYTKELRRYRLAVRMLRYEARTRTIVAWTGVTEDRVRKLAHQLAAPHPERAPLRHRGQSPHQIAFFFRSATVSCQAAVLAGYCEQIGLLPGRPSAVAVRDFASILRGERLCDAYEVYRCGVAKPAITLEHAVLLVTALARGEELTLSTCDECSALWLHDRLGDPYAECTHCRPTYTLPEIPGDRSLDARHRLPSYGPVQMPLFDVDWGHGGLRAEAAAIAPAVLVPEEPLVSSSNRIAGDSPDASTPLQSEEAPERADD